MVYSINEVMMLWESYGIFDTLLPFLLIFAIVFGILTYLRIFGDKKGIHVILALVIGFMAIRTPFFNEFYKEVFPRLGIGVVILLIIMILIGLFVEKEYRRYWAWGLSAIGFIIALVILVQTFGYLGWTGLYGYFGGETVGWIIGAVLLLGIIIAIATSGSEKPGNPVKDAIGSIFKGWYD